VNISIKIVHFPLFKEKLYSIFDMTRLGRLKGILKLQIIGVGAFDTNIAIEYDISWYNKEDL